jgi:signal transduction histidine kinase/CheY-like chemotaxis protein
MAASPTPPPADGAHRALLGIAVLAPCAYAVTTLCVARIGGVPLDWLAELPRLGMLALCALLTYRTCGRANRLIRQASDACAATEAGFQERELEIGRLQHELDLAHSATREQHMFLARLGHQLRAPMDGVLASTELALAAELSLEQRDLLTASRTSGLALLRAVDHVLDAGRIASGEQPLSRAPVDLHDLLARCLGRVLGDAGRELACRMAPDLPAAILTDGERLERVLDHLLEHTVAVAGRGTVVLSAERQGHELRLTVSHGGAGLASAATVRSRLSGGDSLGEEGLGPAVASQLVGLMGGRLFAESEAGMGGRLVLELPCEDAPADATAHDAPGTAPDLTGVAVLVADRSMTSRAILADTLEAWGARVFTVEGGGEALDALELAVAEGRPYGAVLLGADLPERLTFEQRHQRTTNDAPCAVVLLGDPADGAPGPASVSRPVLPRPLARALTAALAERDAAAGAPSSTD